MNVENSRTKSLSSLCELSLMRNHLMLQDVSNMPYRLIRNVLMKVKLEQLCKLEETNSLLIFEDDEIWHNLLVKDYPLHVHESFLRKRGEIMNYFVSFIETYDPSLLRDVELMKGYLRFAIKKDPRHQKYKVPSRMLYFKYQAETVRKQELSTQRLRFQMQELQREKEKNQISALDDPLYCEKRTKSGIKINDRSDLFVKSYKEHQRRQQHFKSGGYDISKRPVKRVAFGGQVGTPIAPSNQTNYNALSDNGTEVKPIVEVPKPPVTLTRPKQPTSPARTRRLNDEPHPFLKRRKPILRRQSLASARPLAQPVERTARPVVVKVGSCRINSKSKKSSIFAAPSPQEELVRQHSSHSNAYIFDSSGR
ncbi:LAME_0G07140g1_1 [Lachancea meyersii CBS 8951]|uniref:Elongin-A n=1 Tax=Lachancea meyersii CBS 8951 TaxID=1266667 RepID=A0A1G4K7U3_9SACH|nr:LAME_0G07140g1_1 [Lachancea meyersii CBS 8951]